jgi:hypothetical protein
MEDILHLPSASEPERFADEVLQTLFGGLQPFPLPDVADTTIAPHRSPLN